MHALPPAANLLIIGGESPWLPAVQFGAEPFIKLCISFDRALKELEARYPSPRPLVTLKTRNKRFKRRPK
jgi:hypothetical protein